jgi:hypothetical protein
MVTAAAAAAAARAVGAGQVSKRTGEERNCSIMECYLAESENERKINFPRNHKATNVYVQEWREEGRTLLTVPICTARRRQCEEINEERKGAIFSLLQRR